MTKYATAGDRPEKEIAGRQYGFRAITLYDLPKMRWRLTRAKVRRPTMEEYEQAALAGVAAMAAIAGDPAAGEAQSDIVEQWYRLLPVPIEDEIDQADEDLRAAELAGRLAERAAAMKAVYPSILAIEANLGRHWSDWCELIADAALWKDYSLIDAARLLLVSIDGEPLPRVADGDDKDLVTDAAFMAIAAEVRVALGNFALALLAPTETERKN